MLMNLSLITIHPHKLEAKLQEQLLSSKNYCRRLMSIHHRKQLEHQGLVVVGVRIFKRMC